MKHSNASIAKCQSHLQPGPWHSRACVPYKERLWESQVHADRVCVVCVCVCVCVRLIECIWEWRGSASEWVDKEREGKKVFWCLLRPYSHPWAVNRERLHSRTEASCLRWPVNAWKHTGQLSMWKLKFTFQFELFREEKMDVDCCFSCHLLLAVALQQSRVFMN